MDDHSNEQPVSKDELAALELYHQLAGMSPEDSDRALLITLRLPNCRLVGELWLSPQDVERLIDAALAIVEQRILHGDPEQPAPPLPIDENDIDADVLGAEAEAFLKNGGQA